MLSVRVEYTVFLAMMGEEESRLLMLVPFNKMPVRNACATKAIGSDLESKRLPCLAVPLGEESTLHPNHHRQKTTVSVPGAVAYNCINARLELEAQCDLRIQKSIKIVLALCVPNSLRVHVFFATACRLPGRVASSRETVLGANSVARAESRLRGRAESDPSSVINSGSRLRWGFVTSGASFVVQAAVLETQLLLRAAFGLGS